MTETRGAATGMIGPDETVKYGSTGCPTSNMEANIVDPTSGEALPPGQHGELWLRGLMVMKGVTVQEDTTSCIYKRYSKIFGECIGVQVPSEIEVTPKLESKIDERRGDALAVLQLIRAEEPNVLTKWETGESSTSRSGASAGASDEE
ncbi:hypothetical protein LguiA_021844 [Lonicera macranthoides]